MRTRNFLHFEVGGGWNKSKIIVATMPNREIFIEKQHEATRVVLSGRAW